MESVAELKSQLAEVITKTERAVERRDNAATDALLAEGESLAVKIKSADRHEKLQSIGRTGPVRLDGNSDSGDDLATALLGAGWNLKTMPSVTVDSEHALRLKAGTVDGDLTQAVQHRFAPRALGIDDRYLYPHLPREAVDPDEVSVGTYRQKSRSLASPSSMNRAIDATSTKPSTSTVAEPYSLDLGQIASVNPGIPNVLLANAGFSTWVNNDLASAWKAAVDFAIIEAIEAELIPAGSGGTNIYEQVVYAAMAVRGAGYSPNVVAVSPTDALALLLLIQEDGDHYVFNQVPPTMVVSPVIEDGRGLVFDPTSLGTLFLGPFSLRVFEEEAGSTNSSAVRGESNGAFALQRPDAAAYLEDAS